MKIFCPGIRENANKQDQKRVLNYNQFTKLADDNCFAVIGRPIYEGNALENIKKIVKRKREIGNIYYKNLKNKNELYIHFRKNNSFRK